MGRGVRLFREYDIDEINENMEDVLEWDFDDFE